LDVPEQNKTAKAKDCALHTFV